MNPIIFYGLVFLAIMIAIGLVISAVEVIEEWGRGVFQSVAAWLEKSLK